jgi:predicted nucleotidyltransferase
MSATDTAAISVDSIVDQAAVALAGQLKENLHSLILYGSAVRGDLVATTSDVNFLVVLQASTSASHRVIRSVVQRFPRLNPFVVELSGMPRAVRVFALKFLSIRRNYRLLHGVDPLVNLQVPRDLELLLAEQELRNFRMRLVHSYVTSPGRVSRYGQFAIRNASRLIIVLSDVLRCADVTLPQTLGQRHIAFTRAGGIDLGHLNPVPRTRSMLDVLAGHVLDVGERCGTPVLLENITTQFDPGGELDEPDFLNQLCEKHGCRLLLDVTNLFINARNLCFDPHAWLRALRPELIVQLHVVGYAERDGWLHDTHGAPLQPDLLELIGAVLAYAPVASIILERDEQLDDAGAIETELGKLHALLPRKGHDHQSASC